MTELSLKIKESLLNKGASLVGFADMAEIPGSARHSMRFAVSVAVRLNAAVIESIRTGPTQEYYSEYKTVNALLLELGEYAANMLREHGYEAVPGVPINVGIDPTTYSTTLPHKTVATRAGLGWIGKCALLVTKEYGSAIRINTVLTNARLDTAVPVNHSSCGDCMICVDVCPGKAPSGENWDVNLHRDSFFNPFSCRRAAREQAGKIGVNKTICGICISVCPWTRKYTKKERENCVRSPCNPFQAD